jgi:hypothetical protein
LHRIEGYRSEHTVNAGVRISIGVIGAGQISQVTHLPALAKAMNIELVAICDPSETLPSGLAARYGIKPVTRTERLLEEDLDAPSSPLLTSSTILSACSP